MNPINTNNAPAAIGPYSQAFTVNGLIFTSGQLPINPTDGTMPETAAAQARQSLENVKAILESAGSSMNKIVKVSVFIKNIDDFASINEVYSQFFSEPFPARSCFEVAALPKAALVEIEVIAST